MMMQSEDSRLRLRWTPASCFVVILNHRLYGLGIVAKILKRF